MRRQRPLFRVSFAALFLFASMISGLLTPQIANATSTGDDAIQLTNELHIGGSGDTCPALDRTTSWNDPDWWKSTWNYQNNYNDARAETDNFINVIQNNMSLGSGWAITVHPNANNGSLNMITIQAFSPSATLTMLSNGNIQVSGTVYSMDIMSNPGMGCRLQNWNAGGGNVSAYGNNIITTGGKTFFIAANSIDYLDGYEGAYAPDSSMDTDEDSLSDPREMTQGTSRTDEDSDNDGITDYVESAWYPGRDDLFCDTAASPYVCAYPDPLKRDVYLEVDWMNDGTISYKPNATQVGLVEDAFDNKDINLHVDTGQYGGGGELPTYVDVLKFLPDANDTDFFNLKNGDLNYGESFSGIRKGVWHYMIAGNKWNDGDMNTHSGVSFAGDDDAFVAVGLLTTNHPTTANEAVAGTMMHELGHNLCLSNAAYVGQDSSCLFSGIETHAGNDYVSSMNYDKQLSLVDYSSGLNGSNDHNDWSAILAGMDDFVTSVPDPTEDAFRRGPAFSKRLEY